MSDLKKLGSFTYGGPPENQTRYEGIVGMRQAYGLNNAVPAELLRQERPDYILSLEVFLRPVLRDDPSALDGYVLERSWPSDAFGSRGLLLYRRG
jgi:hypothetical protein